MKPFFLISSFVFLWSNFTKEGACGNKRCPIVDCATLLPSYTTITTHHVIVHEQRNKEEGERVSERKGVAHLSGFLKSHKTTQNVLRLETIARLSQHLFGNCVDGTLPGCTLTEAHKYDCELKNTLSLYSCVRCDTREEKRFYGLFVMGVLCINYR